MKSIAFAAALALATVTTAQAGSAVYIAPESGVVEAPMANGATNWLIPLAIIAIVALTLTNNDDCRKRSSAASGNLSIPDPCK